MRQDSREPFLSVYEPTPDDWLEYERYLDGERSADGVNAELAELAELGEIAQGD